jgi:hypothetical protein
MRALLVLIQAVSVDRGRPTDDLAMFRRVDVARGGRLADV